MTQISDKIINIKDLWNWRGEQKSKIVVTNGCFDVLHAGHVLYLEKAKSYGDILLVGLDNDENVRKLKGPNRPVIQQNDRSIILAALQMVDFVCVFDNTIEFLSISRPDIYIKGGDYTLDTINQEERMVLKDSKIIIGPLMENRSSSLTIDKIMCNIK